MTSTQTPAGAPIEFRSFTRKDNAIRAAERQNLKVDGLEFYQVGDRWTWKARLPEVSDEEAAAARKPVDPGPVVDPLEIPTFLRADVRPPAQPVKPMAPRPVMPQGSTVAAPKGAGKKAPAVKTPKAKPASPAKPAKAAAKADAGASAPPAATKSGPPTREGQSEKDAACLKLIAREGGATVAEIRKATGWKGIIQKGPERVAKAAGRKLDGDGKGEERRFKLL